MTSKKLSDSDNKSTQTATISTNSKSSYEIYYKVAHAIPGRIRFYIPRLTKDSNYADKLKALVESDCRIGDVRINSQAASIVINYKRDKISDGQIREHLINLIQSAPNAEVPKQATARSILGAAFDALLYLIDSIRNLNKARKGVTEGRFKPDAWERLFKKMKDTIKGLKSAVMFVLPKKSPTDNPNELPTITKGRQQSS